MNQEHRLPPIDDLDLRDGDEPERIAITNSTTTLVPPTKDNQSLQPPTTNPEKDATRQLKRQLKQQSRIRKYELRWSQALGRNDTAIADRAQSELRAYLTSLRDEPNSWWYQQDFPSFYQVFLESSNPTTTMLPSIVALTAEANESSLLVKSRRWMTQQIWQPLVLRMILVPTNGCTKDPTISTTILLEQVHTSNKVTGPTRKQQHTIEARSLLNHMTKGTQTETMFENDAALIGYTRQKFMERALLAFKSLNRLHPLFTASPNTFPGQLWQQLLQVRSILSIGCGPGCDALGVATFLKHYRSNENDGNDNNDIGKHPKNVVLDRIVWMDFVMPQWKRLVLDHLASLLAIETKLVSRVETATCDVRYSLCHDERNQEAWQCLIQDNLPPIDLIVVSYLLTETRGQWIQFFHDLLSHYYHENGHETCLLLLSEPKAWQLHVFTTEFEQFIDGFQWLDSSRDCPDLQPLERRLGPAVLLLRTKRKVE